MGRSAKWLRLRIWYVRNPSSNLGLPTGSNLVVIKTQGVLKGYIGDNYSSHQIEDGILYKDIILLKKMTLIKVSSVSIEAADSDMQGS